MTHGIRTVRSAALLLGVLVVGCAEPAQPAQLTAVDQLIFATDGATLTLNELDRERYDRSDSMFAFQQPLFTDRFTDTLNPVAAQALGSQYISLRASANMGRDHVRVLDELITTSARLRILRKRLADGTMDRNDGATAIAAEQQHHTAVIVGVHVIMDNYRQLQRAWDRRDTVNTLLALGQQPTMP
ncbi:MAG: hypothetical protein IPP83_06825 [Flavobacteriales bacterium]|nr:hypothetical protein [Flavobacteriales bacterium]